MLSSLTASPCAELGAIMLDGVLDIQVTASKLLIELRQTALRSCVGR